MREYLSLKQLSEYSGLHVNTLRAWLKRDMPHYRCGKRILVKRSEFDAWMRKFRRGTRSLQQVLEEVLEEVESEEIPIQGR
ncbi:MAG: helix-turn-helix domain-containing protein [Deltaproteobacteria bacterium]|nr:helix-turn-helix domain-containing protein [Deltaproteobacteria bacterium]